MSLADCDSRLTVAMIVRDAAEALDETLRSIRDIANEIIVVDTGSTDDTVEVARRHAAVLVRQPWADDFAAARNEAFLHATGDWLLWLDAGETLTAEDAKGLRAFLDREADSSKAYMLMVQTAALAATAPAEQIGRVRLVPNTNVIEFRGRVRESLAQSLAENLIEVEGLPYRILRGPRQHDPQLKTSKAKRNIRLAELESQEGDPDPRLLNCLGDAFQTLGDNTHSSQFFRAALEVSQEGSSDMLEAYYGLLTSLEGGGSTPESQLAICLEALEVFPLDSQLLCAMGGYLQTQGRLDLAARAYLTAQQYGKVSPEVWHLLEIGEVAAACHSLALQLQGKNEEAERFLQEALAANQNSARLRRQLLELNIKLGRRDEALMHLEAIAAQTPHAEALRSAVRGACLAQEKNWIAARAYLDAAYQAGSRDPICLRWLTIALAAAGETDRARAIFEQWRELDPSVARVAEGVDSVAADAESSTDGRRFRVDPALSPHPTANPLANPVARALAADTPPASPHGVDAG